MRRWLLVFIVLLLPLRGLLGEVMAGQIPQHHAATAVQAAMPMTGHDCDEHRHAPAAEPAQHHAMGDEPPADCPTCASCQVCSSVALSPLLAPAAAERASQPLPRLAQRDPSSAEPALAFKPPRG